MTEINKHEMYADVLMILKMKYQDITRQKCAHRSDAKFTDWQFIFTLLIETLFLEKINKTTPKKVIKKILFPRKNY